MVWDVLIILTKDKIPLAGSDLDRRDYEKRIEQMRLTSEVGKIGPPVPYGNFVMLDLLMTDCSVDKAYKFLDELIKKQMDKQPVLSAST
jgi:hypothetical protein